MKNLLRLLRLIFVTFGIYMGFMFIYFLTVSEPASDWFVMCMPMFLAYMLALDICGERK